jgi:hypothetical protein
MKKITVRVIIAILTFIIGITVAAIWLSKPNKRFADDIYFPGGVFSPHEDGMYWIAKFYSSSLAAMQEPPLSSIKDKNSETYRFLWLRSFHPPVSIRLYRAKNQSYIIVKQLSGVGVPENGAAIFPKTLTVNETRPISEAEWEHFQELLKKSGFWLIPTEDGKPIGLDGAGWLLEGVKSGQYHVVDRQSPEQGDFREACVYLLRISGVNINESKGELY